MIKRYGVYTERNCRMSNQLTSMTDSLKTATADKYVIHLGQTFSTYDDYLQLTRLYLHLPRSLFDGPPVVGYESHRLATRRRRMRPHSS